MSKIGLDERIEFARLAVKMARRIDEPSASSVLDLAATPLPWETETPPEFVVAEPRTVYSFSEDDKIRLTAQREAMYSPDERIQWARIHVRYSRRLGVTPDARLAELAATQLPWEDAVPAEYEPGHVPAVQSQPPRIRSAIRRFFGLPPSPGTDFVAPA